MKEQKQRRKKIRTVRIFLRAVAGIAAIFLMWTVLGVQQSMAQSPTPCLPDCFNDPWNKPALNSVGTVECELRECNVTVRIYWRARVACGTYYDYYLEKVEFLAGAASLQHCLQAYGSVRALVEAIADCLLKINPANFPPHNPGDCNYNWRVVQGPCWGPFGDELRPCDFSECCLALYRVCRDQDGNRIITKLETIQQGVCDVVPAPGMGCELVCH